MKIVGLFGFIMCLWLELQGLGEQAAGEGRGRIRDDSCDFCLNKWQGHFLRV